MDLLLISDNLAYKQTNKLFTADKRDILRNLFGFRAIDCSDVSVICVLLLKKLMITFYFSNCFEIFGIHRLNYCSQKMWQRKRNSVISCFLLSSLNFDKKCTVIFVKSRMHTTKILVSIHIAWCNNVSVSSRREVNNRLKMGSSTCIKRVLYNFGPSHCLLIQFSFDRK